MYTITQVFAAIGLVQFIPQLYRLWNFLSIYFFRPSTIHQYLHAAPAYALVTGATDGIGKALATELYSKGFSLILHGRNEEKMRKVVEEIRGTGSREVLYFLADASEARHDFGQIMAPYKDLNITLVVHNVGFGGPRKERIDGWSEEDVLQIVHCNAIFPLLLARTLLPQLRRSAKHGPVLVQFVGSLTSEVSPPRLAVYAASKSFLKVLARGLDIDERVWGAPTGVRFECIIPGQVQSNLVRVPASLDTPTSAQFAQAIVARMGCGWRIYAPYWVHSVMIWVTAKLGEKATETFSATAIAKLLEQTEKQA